ncbi:MAG TPA: MFS transporter [Pilimelia sp.]|nr:MFS transporter [Pilimelia sp.]
MPSPTRLTVAFYAYHFFIDFVLLYPVYALLFSDTGLSVAEISSLFVIWSVTGLVLEVPSGALADRLSRRLLLIIAPLLTGAGYTLWLLAPSYAGFALGFVLWGAAGALQSGAVEALAYEELDHHGAASAYPRLIGRAKAIGVAAVMLATAAAASAYAWGGLAAVGVASVLACLAASAAGVALPEHRGDRDGDDPEPGYLATLRDGVSASWRQPGVRAAVLLVPGVAAVYGSLEEYTPLLARETGVSDGTVPLLVLLIEAAVAAGGLLAAAASRLPVWRFAAVLAGAAVVMAAGAYRESVLGFGGVAVAFCVYQAATVVADVRLQRAITGGHRATITSVAGFATEIAGLAVFGLYAAAATRLSHGAAFAWFAVPYLLTALVWAASRNGSGRLGAVPRADPEPASAGGRPGQR